MPRMTGVELFRRLISIGSSIPTILITAYPNEEDRREMLRLGAECYLRKPLVENELIACLRSACSRGKGPKAPS
jgi:DNA-binding response OmpR family regulator